MNPDEGWSAPPPSDGAGPPRSVLDDVSSPGSQSVRQPVVRAWRPWQDSRVLGLAVLVVLSVPVLLAGDPAGLLWLWGAVALGTALWALLGRRPSWLRLRGPRARTAVLAIGAVLIAAASFLLSMRSSASTPGPFGSPASKASSSATASASDPTRTPSTVPSAAPTASVLPAAGPAVSAQQTLALLGTLPVKGRAPKTGYERVEDFGEAWTDVDRNGCDTRDDILARDLADAVIASTCKVVSGVLADPYTGRTIDFTRGETTSALVQIDHVVALSNAWQTGAQQLTPGERLAFANDPLNLLAVDGETNQQKSDGDAATWLPPQRQYWCTYVSRQVQVKAKYHLWVTPAEHDAITRVLGGCAS